MCTTIGFKCNKGFIFGRTLEIGIPLEHDLMYVPASTKSFIQGNNNSYDSIFSTLGTAFAGFDSYGDGINDQGLMGSSNFFPGFGSFSEVEIEGKINLILSEAFDYILSSCKDIEEVVERIAQINIVEKYPNHSKYQSMSNHFFFMDIKGKSIVLEPIQGKLNIYQNPYGVLTNAPEFSWHTTNLKNTIHFNPNNVDSNRINGVEVTKLGEGSGMLGLPGDFTPPSRFIRAAHFVSGTPKDLPLNSAMLQGFRILSQFDIPKGSVYDPVQNHYDETLYTSMMNNHDLLYTIKCHDNIDIQKFSLMDFENLNEITRIKLQKDMTF